MRLRNLVSCAASQSYYENRLRSVIKFMFVHPPLPLLKLAIKTNIAYIEKERDDLSRLVLCAQLYIKYSNLMAFVLKGKVIFMCGFDPNHFTPQD